MLFVKRRPKPKPPKTKAESKSPLDPIKLIICRRDLPPNPNWWREGYPREDCWDIDEFFETAVRAGPGSTLWSEARRIWFEAYWRLLGRYKRGRPFFEVYLIEDGKIRRLEDRERWVLSNIIASGIIHGIVPREALESPYRIYERLYGRPVARD